MAPARTSTSTGRRILVAFGVLWILVVVLVYVVVVRLKLGGEQGIREHPDAQAPASAPD